MYSNSLTHSFRIQCRVVGALLMREIITRYGRHNIGFLWVFFEPMMFTLGITALWTATKATHGSNLPITAFAVTGYSTVLLWRNCVNRCALAILPNQSLLYHRNVRVLDIFIARILLEVSGATMSLIFLSSLFIMFGMMEPPDDIALMFGGWIYLALLGTGLGFTIGALTERSETVDRIWHTVAYLLFPLSGAIYLVDWLPPAAQKFVLLLPMVHGVEMLRSGYFGPLIKPHYDVSYMIASDLVLLLVGLLLVRETSQRVEPE
ncbi:ABC transporter permease [Paraburkholderia caballeronis]|uniref:Transport permease protein n=1 Tax=Paraburkholderia caballeronis TaxID=416943 RepID=A0A1H7H9F0_9BURK|nr:ABC transporter permease [Paraburkholderia caballeronis]PXW29598.1 capsular polysaccharide transport system permease protein [Paraburkholderia caballeronis]PXX04857.1 capsular polysaccharide transport system permease protein [Paraburkholderia caballeronis]RAK05918.1 capsular polysaccharide transport system permease protein [Paraburkholderia caballeronis]TDV11130.1 capsular polysaccharide transport system permease protein [Paraburkholderia caballeronis]TDV14180.1 capsular polysaccharide tran